MTKEDTRTIINKILKVVFKEKEFDLRKFLFEIVKIGQELLGAKSCSLFLLEPDGKTLKIKAGAGKIGKKLQEAGAKYYIPKREVFTKRPKGVLTDFSSENIGEISEEEMELMEKEKLTMGLTAWVVKTGNSIEACEAGARKDVKNRSEWRGKYEKTQGENCGSIVEVPLEIKNFKCEEKRSEAQGVIKVENVSGDGACFTGDSLEVLEALASCVPIALERLEKEQTSYQELFVGQKLLKNIYSLKDLPVDGKINNQIKEKLVAFAEEVLEWNLYGKKNIYKGIYKLIGEINSILGFNNKCLKVFDDIAETFEHILAADPKYRDHLVHQFQVFLLGYYIINKSNKVKNTLLNYLKENDIPNEIDNVIKCWFLTSIFHDLAYSIEKINSWLGEYFQTLFSMKIPLDHLPFVFLWENIFSLDKYEYCHLQLIALLEKRSQIEENVFPKLDRLIKDNLVKHLDIDVTSVQYVVKNHGLFSALILMNTLINLDDNSCNADNKPDNKIVKEAAFAIAVHTTNIYNMLSTLKHSKLSSKNMPFAFLLAFCDNAQEWGRPWMQSLELGSIALDDIVISTNSIEIDLIRNKELRETDLEDLRRFMNNLRNSWENRWEDVVFHLTYYHKGKASIIADF